MARQVQIPIRGGKLEGELSLPDGAIGLVLFVHGSGSSRKSPRNQFVARYLREHGMGTLLMDLLTPEEEKQDALTSEYRFNIELLKERVLEVTEWIDSLKLDLPLGYFGASTGAAAALAAAAERPEIRAIVSRGGRPDLVLDIVSKVKAPTLLIVGSYDFSVIEMNQTAHIRMRCAKQLVLVPRATHLFEETGALEEVAHLAAAWFYDCFSSTALKKSA